MHYHIVPKESVYCQVLTLGVDLPAPINVYAIQPSIPSDGGIVTPASPHHPIR